LGARLERGDNHPEDRRDEHQCRDHGEPDRGRPAWATARGDSNGGHVPRLHFVRDGEDTSRARPTVANDHLRRCLERTLGIC
jgi:hypothetical protein